jgi:hypothetical protein
MSSEQGAGTSASTSERAPWGLPSTVAFVVAAAVAALASFREIWENDTGWHLALGRIFATDGFKQENGLSWTAPHYHWYPTSWLYDWVTWLAYDHAGVIGIQVFTFALMLLVLVALAMAVRSSSPAAGIWALVIAMILVLPRISVRPHVASWVVLAWTLACGRLGQRRGWRWRAAAIPAIAIGMNLHAGASLSTGVLGLFCLEAMWRERRFVHDGLVALGGVLVLLLPPGGRTNIDSLRNHLHLDDVVQLWEYRPPTVHFLWHPIIYGKSSVPAIEGQPGFFFILGLVVILGFRLWRSQPANLLACAAVACLSFTHGQRWIFEFFLLAAPLLADGVAVVGPRRARTYLFATAALSLACIGNTFLHFPLGPRFDRRQFPVRAARFIQEEGLGGKFFNSYHDGGYLALTLPQNPVYMDSRPLAYPPEFFTKELMAETNRDLFQKYMKFQDITWAITGDYGFVPTGRAVLSGRRLFDSPEWALVYWDDISEVFLRRDIPEYTEKIRRLEMKYFRRSVIEHGGMLASITSKDATPEVLDAYERELDRYDRFTPDSNNSHTARCLIAIMRAQGQKVECPDAPNGAP